jgi:hypothetical protein
MQNDLFDLPNLKADFSAASKDEVRRPAAHLPVSLRMTFEERARLERDASGMSLSAYIRWRLFNPDNPPPKLRGKFPVKDHLALSQVLALLGQSRLSNNLNQLAKAANSGSLPFTPETEVAIADAAASVLEMRAILMHALNLEAD